jgi:hypothetical protein
MKKFFVLAVLFLLPIIAYLFFASGVNNFARLPVVTRSVQDISHFDNQGDSAVTFQEKISVVAFFGSKPEDLKGNTFNLDQKILTKFYEFSDFQFVIVLPEEARLDAEEFTRDFSGITNSSYWKFVYAAPEEVRKVLKVLRQT